MKKLLLFIFALFLWTGAWADSKTVYFDPTTSNWDHSTAVFSVYTWGAGKADAWIKLDGKKTATINGYSCYEVEIPDGYTGMKFVRQDPKGNRTDWSSRWNETSDITIENNTLYTITNGEATSSYSAATVYSAKFVTNASWTNMYAYAWTGESGSETKYLGDWPGKSMSSTGETYGTTSNQIYSIKFTATAIPAKIIFNDGTNGGAVGTNQTADLVFGDNELYVVPIALPSDPSIDPNRVISITGFHGEKDGAYGADGMNKTATVSGRKVYHAVTPSANSRIEGIGIGGLATKQMEKLHLAVWAKESVENAKIQVYSGGWQSATKNLTGGQWNVFDIALDEFSSPLVDAYALKVVNESGAALGTEIYITDVFFYNEGTKPMLTASIVSHTGTSVDLKMSSYKSASATTDAISYTIAWTGDGNKVVNKANGDEFTETIDGLTQGNTYTFSITAKDDNNVVSDAKELTVTLTVPPTSVPYPSQDNSNVISVYSQKFGDITGLAYGGNWTNTEEVIDGSKTRKIEKLVYGNFSFTSTDMSTMEKLHFDVYPMENMPQIGLRVQGVGLDSHYKKVLTLGTWNSFDIDLSKDLGLTTTQLENINNIQIVSDINGSGGNINGDGTGSFYIGNVYFWKTPAVDEVKPVMVSAVHESKTYDSATLTLNATDNSGKVKFHIVDATNGVDVTTDIANSGENFEYTVTELYDNTNYNFTVTAVDSKGNVSDNSVVMSTITTDAAPSGQEKVKETHTVFLIPYHYVNTNVYELIITCEENLTGLGGAYWHTSAGDKALDLDYVINSDKKSMVIRTESTSNPNMYTPLYVKINGDEVSFDNSITWIEKHADAVSVSVNEWASFSSAKGLDFSNVVGLKAYKVTSNSNTSVSYTSVDEAAANTGLVLNGAQRTYYVPVKTTASSHNDNLLKGTATAAKIITAEEAATNKFYAFGKKAGEIGFVKAAAGYKVSAGKAYLELTNALAANGREFIGLPGAEESETDGINKVNTLVENGVRYNLAGQRVGKDYKGIVIVNGRKVVIK